MQSLVLLPLLVASACAGLLHGVEHVPQLSQEQNTATGEYGYSYFGGPSAKTEYRALDGTTTGSYSYVDGHGVLQTVNYIADEFGFRAAGSNIPAQLDGQLENHAHGTVQTLGHLRRKRGALLPAAVATLATVPVATSHQSRFQIHNDAHVITHHALAAPALVAAAPPPALFYRRKRSPGLYLAPYQPALAAKAVLPLTEVHHVPVATSHQSRFQIHKDAKIVQEIHQPIYAPVAAAPVVAHAPLVADTLLPAGWPYAGLHPVAALPEKAESVLHDSEAIAVESA